jgi:hypothetical protein
MTLSIAQSAESEQALESRKLGREESMVKTAILTGALVVAAGLSPAGAQSWSVGVGVGYGEPPGYYGPPPAYLYEQPPVLYSPPPVYAPPPVVYAPPPVAYAPAPAVRSAVSPDAVFDALERAGYRELSPMAFRDGVYKLNAVNRRGDLVALEVSALSGEVEREFVLDGARRPVPPVVPHAARPAAVNPPTASQAPKPGSQDPLVVY